MQALKSDTRNQDLLLSLGLALLPAASFLVARAISQTSLPSIEYLPFVLIPALLILVRLGDSRDRAGFNFGLPELAVSLYAIGVLIAASHGEGPSKLSALLQGLVPFLLGWFLGRQVARVSGTGYFIWWTALLVIVINAPIGLAEFITKTDLAVFPDSELVVFPESGLIRGNGLFGSDIDFVAALTISLAVILGGPSPRAHDTVGLWVVFLAGVAIGVSSVRTAWISVAILLILWLVYSFSLKRLVYCAGLIALTVLMFIGASKIESQYLEEWGEARGIIVGQVESEAPQAGGVKQEQGLNSRYLEERVTETFNSGSRITLASHALQIFRDNPIFGVGLNGFQVEPLVTQNRAGYLETPHNELLGTLAETGLFGAVPLLLVALSTILGSRVLYERRLVERVGVRGTVWTLIPILILSLTFEVISIPFTALIVGLCVGTIRGLVLAEEGAT